MARRGAVLLGVAAMGVVAAGGWVIGLMMLALAALVRIVARPAAVAPGDWAGEEFGSWTVELQSSGPRAIHVIAVLRAEGRLDFATAKAATCSDRPVAVLAGVSRTVADTLVEALRAEGAFASAFTTDT